MEHQEQTIDVRDLIWRVRQYGWLLVLPVVVCVCAAALFCKFTVRVYTSYILVTVDETVRMSAALDPLVRVEREDNPRERVTIVDSKIRSRAFLAALADRLGMTRTPEILLRAKAVSQQLPGITPEEYVQRSVASLLGRKITVSPGRASMIRIAVADASPEAARRLAAMIGTLLVEESRRSELARGLARGEFSRDQISVYEERLGRAEDALRAFQESQIRTRLSSGDVTETNLSRARTLHSASQEEIRQVQSRIRTATTEWRATAGDVSIPDLSSPRTTELIRLLGNLETSYLLAQLRGQSDVEESEGLRKRITSTRQSLYAELTQLAQALPGDFSRELGDAAVGIALDRAVLRSLNERRDRLGSEIETYLGNAERSPRDEIELSRLKEQVQTSRDLVTALRKEAASSRLSEALAISALGPRMDIVEQPLLPLAPSWPDPLRIFGIAGMTGALVAAGIVFAGERLNLVVRTLEQTEAEYGVRVIGTIPRIEGWSRPGGYIRNHWAVLAVLLVLFLTGLAYVFGSALPGLQPLAGQTVGLLQP